jgi:hypothetical protein
VEEVVETDYFTALKCISTPADNSVLEKLAALITLLAQIRPLSERPSAKAKME